MEGFLRHNSFISGLLKCVFFFFLHGELLVPILICFIFRQQLMNDTRKETDSKQELHYQRFSLGCHTGLTSGEQPHAMMCNNISRDIKYTGLTQPLIFDFVSLFLKALSSSSIRLFKRICHYLFN